MVTRKPTASKTKATKSSNKTLAQKRKEAFEKKQYKIAKDYAALAEDIQGVVTLNHLIDIGYTRDIIVHYFRSLSRLNKYARSKFPKSFFDIPISNLIHSKETDSNPTAYDLVTKYKRFVITTAVTSCPINNSALDSILSYCNQNDAACLVMMSSDPAHNWVQNNDMGSIDKRLVGIHNLGIVLHNIQLNNNLHISTIKLSAKQIDPITGLSRIGQEHGSFIYASPKQRLKLIATSNNKLPRMAMTTGAITSADYCSTNYMSQRTAYIADNDHVDGALIVEIQDDKVFHYRQVQFDEDGSFIDLGVKYNPDGTTNRESAYFVMGDWHSGSTDPAAKKCWFEVAEEVDIIAAVVHDLYDGLSINPHEMKNNIRRAQLANDNKLSLRHEILGVASDINELHQHFDQLVIVKSNHDEFLNRYLKGGDYVHDHENHRYALSLAINMLDGLDPLKTAVMENVIHKDRIRWLERDEDFKIANIQLGAHGDLGSNGARGSLKSIEEAYGSSVSGHSHVAEIIRQAWSVGTSSFLKLGYNRGASSWLQTSCLVYTNGHRQLINCINGKWKI